jgi:hypothetical protein
LERGVFDSYCDPEGHHWKSGLGAWSFIFYISKYYEFVDTWYVPSNQIITCFYDSLAISLLLTLYLDRQDFDS